VSCKKVEAKKRLKVGPTWNLVEMNLLWKHWLMGGTRGRRRKVKGLLSLFKSRPTTK
jgi:hypothetical protein